MFILIGLIGLIVWIVCLVFNVRIANKKGRKHVGAWVVFSIFFSLIALIVNAAIPKRGSKLGASQRFARNTQSSAKQSYAGNTQSSANQSYAGDTQSSAKQSSAGDTQSKTASRKIFCTYCGQEIKENARFCHKCGKPVNAGKFDE